MAIVHLGRMDKIENLEPCAISHLKLYFSFPNEIIFFFFFTKIKINSISFVLIFQDSIQYSLFHLLFLSKCNCMHTNQF